MRCRTHRLHAALGIAVIVLFTAPPLRADLTAYDFFKSILYSQTSGLPPVSPVGFFAGFREFMQAAGDFDSASVTYPGPDSPQALALLDPTTFAFGSPFFATQAAMDIAYPFGTYTFDAQNSITLASQTVSLDYLLDAYTADIPALTAATFAALQGMNPSAPFTFNFNSFTPDPGADLGETFLTVFGSTFNVGIPNTSTSALMAANTLLPNTTYTWELDFSDRILGTDPLSGVPFVLGFDVRTDGEFTTGPAVPEPVTLVTVGLTLLGMAGAVRRFRSR